MGIKKATQQLPSVILLLDFSIRRIIQIHRFEDIGWNKMKACLVWSTTKLIRECSCSHTNGHQLLVRALVGESLGRRWLARADDGDSTKIYGLSGNSFWFKDEFICSVSQYDKGNERAGVWYRKEGKVNVFDMGWLRMGTNANHPPEEYVPPPRYFHTSDTCALPYLKNRRSRWIYTGNDHLIIFGGMSNQSDITTALDELCVLNHIHFFNFTTRRWLPAPDDISNPELVPRSLCSLLVHNWQLTEGRLACCCKIAKMSFSFPRKGEE